MILDNALIATAVLGTGIVVLVGLATERQLDEVRLWGWGFGSLMFIGFWYAAMLLLVASLFDVAA